MDRSNTQRGNLDQPRPKRLRGPALLRTPALSVDAVSYLERRSLEIDAEIFLKATFNSSVFAARWA